MLSGEMMEPVTSPLAPPLIGMMVLTLLVWLTMFARRLIHFNRAGVDAQTLQTPEQVAAVLPPAAAAPGNNFKNLFELPVIFYAICLYLMVAGQDTGALTVYCAWAFVGLRALHSLVHCTYNNVMHRFLLYFLSSVALFVLIIHTALTVL
jgi:hypothetical protein